ncbi:hypothetical protein FD64_15065, partial [Staphylococcus aureus]
IQDRAHHHGQRGQHQAACRQHGLADDDGSQADDDGADTHRHVSAALRLRVKRTSKGDQRVGQRHAGQRGAAGSHALGARHARVGAGGTQRQANLR